MCEVPLYSIQALNCSGFQVSLERGPVSPTRKAGKDDTFNEVEHGSGLGAFLEWGGKPQYLPFPLPE